MTLNSIDGFNVLLPICCHIDSGMPYLRELIEDVFALLGAMAIIGIRNKPVVGIRK